MINSPTTLSDPAKMLASVDLYSQGQNAFDAINLIELGARATLVQQLTGLERKVIKRLYFQLWGKASPAGPMPFSDSWYLKDPKRMLHATLVWRLHKSASSTGRTQARILIDIYTSYQSLVTESLLCLARVSFIPDLMAMNIWYECKCTHCNVRYLTSIDQPETTCPGCTLYFRHRCRQCEGAIEATRQGRYRKSCDACQLSQGQ